ncbi:MAG: hypothetical protein ABR508_07780 [Candidatus Baltobacteraceae bacterium]
MTEGIVRPASSTRVLFLGSIVLALALSACGGGGGGGTPPAPGGGNGGGASPTPTPTGHATATPTPTSHATATPTPTVTPTPGSTPATQSITMQPDTSGRFGLTQILDNYGGEPALTSSQIQSEAPRYDSVWGAFSPQTWRAANSRIILSRYMVPPEDDNLVSTHDLSWWQTNHPDWILYACDSSGNPTHDLAWSGSYFTDVPLAFYEPAVQQYQMQLLIPYLQANSYNALAADNTDLINYLDGGNPNFGQSVKSGEYGCGTYDASGTFQRRYGTPGTTYNRNDPQFAQDMVAWVGQTSSAVHGAGLKLLINHPLYNHPTNPSEEQILSYTDGMVDENGYTAYGSLLTANAFANTLEWVEYTQQHHIAVLVTDYYCTGSGCSNDPSTLTPQQVDWALATYAIGNEGGEDVYISPHGGSNYSYRNEYSTTYGAACGAYTQPSTNVYERKFQGGLSIVNATGNPPNGTPYSLALPSGRTYTDIEGRAVSNPLTVNPADAYFLLTSNGCS